MYIAYKSGALIRRCAERLFHSTYPIYSSGPHVVRFFVGGGVHLLYLDEPGHSHDPASEFFVLAGFSIFERQTHWLESQIDPIALRFSQANPRDIEFHGSPMLSGKDLWKDISPQGRVQAVVDILLLLSDRQLKLQVYACVIEKKLFVPNDILARSFEEIANCFDGFLKTLFRKKNPQRGLVILDKSNYEEKIQTLSHIFKHVGHANGQLRNFAEVPLFLDSKASRLIQMADLNVNPYGWFDLDLDSRIDFGRMAA